MVTKRSNNNYCAGCMGERLVIQTTVDCNGHCKFCVASHNINEGKTTIDELLKVSNLYKDYQHVLILGGESMLYPKDVITLIDGLYKQSSNRKITINTNGTNLKYLIQVADKLDKLIVSIMHWDANRNKEIMGVKPNLTYIKELAKLNPKLKLRVNCVVHKSGVSSLEDMKTMSNYCKDLGFNSIKFSEMTTEGELSDEFIDIQELCKDFGDVHQSDTITDGCYLEPKSLENLYGIKTILNLTCHLKCPCKQPIYKDRLYSSMTINSVYISPMGKVATKFISSEDKSNDRGGC